MSETTYYQFDKIAKFIDYRGKTPKKTESGIPLITAKNIKFGYLSVEPKEYISENDYDSWMSRGIPQKGNVLFTTEAPLGNVCMLDTDEKRAFAQRAIIFQPLDENTYISKYLFYYMMSNIFKDELDSKKTGTTVKGIKSTILKKFQIPLPSFSEQQRIVSKLDNLFEKIDKAIALHQKNIDESNVFMRSVLNDIFDDLEEKYYKEKFDEIKLSNVIGLVKNAKEQSPSLAYQYVKMNNITNDNRFTFNKIINVDATKEEVEKFNLQKGDFLFNTRNSVELVGKSCVFNYEIDNILFNNNIMRVRFRADISSYFVSYQFGSGFIKRQLDSIKSATTNVAAIYYKTLKDIDIITPPSSIQQKIVNYLDEVSEKIEKVKLIQKEKMNNLKDLKASILDKAFRGEL